MRAGGCPAVVAQWQSTGGSSQRSPGFPEVSWVRPQVTAGFFIFLYFHPITSKFLYFQHEARCSQQNCKCFNFGFFVSAKKKTLSNPSNVPIVQFPLLKVYPKKEREGLVRCITWISSTSPPFKNQRLLTRYKQEVLSSHQTLFLVRGWSLGTRLAVSSVARMNILNGVQVQRCSFYTDKLICSSKL